MTASIEITLSKLFSSYTNTEVSEATVAVYVEILCDIPPDELAVVVRQCLLECKFLPTIAEIFDRWRTLTTPPQLGVSDAWGMVQAEIRSVGSWGTPQFSDPLVSRVVAAMGWLELCQSENGMADRAHFMKLYGDLQARGEQSARLTDAARQLADRHTGLTHISAYLPKQKWS